jgi:hypothetical protein
MKKLLYTLLAVSIIFSACKKEDEESNNNNNIITTCTYINDTNSYQTIIPDTNWEKKLIQKGVDDILDGFVYTHLIDTLVGDIYFTFGSYNIADFTGIENFTSLSLMHCSGNNNLTGLCLSRNIALTYLDCSENANLHTLNIKNGNNTNMGYVSLSQNPNLTCITVDDAAWSTANWTNRDPHHYFSEGCP